MTQSQNDITRNAAGPQRPRTVLVADDENHIRAVVIAKIRSAGYNVLEARDGEEALELARLTTPDLVVTDLQMPFMSGLELCLRLKSDPRTASTPVIMLTARGHILDADVVAQTNIKETIAKPFGARDLLRRIDALIAASVAGDAHPAAGQAREAA